MHLVYLGISDMKLIAKTALLSNSISPLFSPNRIYSRKIYSNTTAKPLMQIIKKNHQIFAPLLLLLLVPSLPSTGQFHHADAISSRLEMALLPPGAALVSVVMPPGICVWGDVDDEDDAAENNGASPSSSASIFRSRLEGVQFNPPLPIDPKSTSGGKNLFVSTKLAPSRESSNTDCAARRGFF